MPELTEEEKRLLKQLRSYHNGSYAKLLDKLVAMSSAQPEIIRCKDCKYQDKGETDCESWNLCGYRPWLYAPVTDNHYCGYAKQKRR